MSNETIHQLRRVQKNLEEIQLQSEVKIKFLEEKIDLKEAEIEQFLEEREKMMKENMTYHRQILRLQRQSALLAKKTQNKEETSIKQRPRRCSAPSVLDLTA